MAVKYEVYNFVADYENVMFDTMKDAGKYANRKNTTTVQDNPGCYGPYRIRTVNED